MEALLNELATTLSRVKKPKKALITAGMPYANGPLHIGHLAGTHIPADIYARYQKMLIGSENVLFVCGTDDHGSTSEFAAKKAGKTIEEFIAGIHAAQADTLKRYGINLDVYTGTSRAENYETHKNYCQDFLRKLYHNGMLDKRSSLQWFDPKIDRFLPDRYVYGNCPNPECDNEEAYSEECDVCGHQYESKELQNPKSRMSDASPELKETNHWWLNMWKCADELKTWIESRQKTWRKNVYLETIGTVTPCLTFSNKNEDDYKNLKNELPKHKSRYAPGKKVLLQFESLADLNDSKTLLNSKSITTELVDNWAHRSITRDVDWGIPVPSEIDPEMKGKTLYVWPESLIAPICFSQLALKQKGLSAEEYKKYWTDPDAGIYQFIGQDNIFFYVVMQGAMWFGTQAEVRRMPVPGELQMSDVIANYHLQAGGYKMSKSKGNFYTGDQLLDEMKYDADQIRYFLSILGLGDKNSNFDFDSLNQRNEFLAGPLNAAFEKPISAVHSKFDSIIPEGELIGKTEKETIKIFKTYLKWMEKAEYSKILFEIENYARIINGLFAQYKPHDDRHDEKQRKDALYSSFYILRNILIMLHPFVPATMEKLRNSLNFPESVYSISEFGKALPQNHKIGEQTQYFPGNQA